jgi:hypothetical protein
LCYQFSSVPLAPLLAPLVAMSLAQSAPPGRGLTAGERALLAPLFRDSVDYHAVRIVRGRAFPLQGPRTLVTIRDVVYAPREVYCDDFAYADLDRQAVLVHEVAHVWQHQNGIAVFSGAVRALVASGGRYSRAYYYDLVPGRDLIEYGVEQQAMILEHYFLASGPDAAEFDDVLRRFLHDPRYPRHWTPRRRRS